MVQASIKREKDADCITGGKDYPVVGYMGGCVIIVDDKNRFLSLSFANVADEWSVSTDAPKADEAKIQA